LISWKYTFKRLNEEYELANKKKQALDNLCATGKISQLTRDSFTSDIVKAIEDIEKQRQDLAEKMQAKTQEIDGQIKTLEMLLANYEIQHVVGEIDDDIYEREITLLSTSLETSRNELSVLKDATNQLFPSPKPIEAPAAIQAEEQAESTPLDVAIETPTIEPTIIETATTEPTSIEIEPIEDPLETMQAETAPIQEAPIETPIIEEASMEAAVVEEAPVMEEAPVEEAQFTPAEVEMVNEAAPEEVMAESVVEEATVNMEEASPMDEPVAEAQVEIETSPEEVANAEIAPEPTVAVPLQSFEVTEHSPMETTLEKLMDQTIEEQINQPVIVEEAHIQAHPLEAPQQAPSEEILDADTATDQTPQTDENEEDTTE